MLALIEAAKERAAAALACRLSRRPQAERADALERLAQLVGLGDAELGGEGDSQLGDDDRAHLLEQRRRRPAAASRS